MAYSKSFRSIIYKLCMLLICFNPLALTPGVLAEDLSAESVNVSLVDLFVDLKDAYVDRRGTREGYSEAKGAFEEALQYDMAVAARSGRESPEIYRLVKWFEARSESELKCSDADFVLHIAFAVDRWRRLIRDQYDADVSERFTNSWREYYNEAVSGYSGGVEDHERILYELFLRSMRYRDGKDGQVEDVEVGRLKEKERGMAKDSIRSITSRSRGEDQAISVSSLENFFGFNRPSKVSLWVGVEDSPIDNLSPSGEAPALNLLQNGLIDSELFTEWIDAILGGIVRAYFANRRNMGIGDGVIVAATLENRLQIRELVSDLLADPRLPVEAEGIVRKRADEMMSSLEKISLWEEDVLRGERRSVLAVAPKELASAVLDSREPGTRWHEDSSERDSFHGLVMKALAFELGAVITHGFSVVGQEDNDQILNEGMGDDESSDAIEILNEGLFPVQLYYPPVLGYIDGQPMFSLTVHYIEKDINKDAVVVLALIALNSDLELGRSVGEVRASIDAEGDKELARVLSVWTDRHPGEVVVWVNGVRRSASRSYLRHRSDSPNLTRQLLRRSSRALGSWFLDNEDN